MSRLFRVLAGAVFVSVILSITASPTVAEPPVKPGAPTDLVLGPATKSGSTFAVRADWGAGTHATKYAVKLTSAGATLDSATVTTLSWTGYTTRPDGSTVKVSVTSFNGRRRGGTATRSLVLPDMTAPTASYTIVSTIGSAVTVGVSSLADNTTPTAGISQVIDWADPDAVDPTPVTWDPGQAEISYTYPDKPGRYEAKVTVTDQFGNSRVYPLVIVVNDGIDPEGEFALATPSAWAGWTKVRLAQAAIQDNLSPADKISRVISWGDGAQTVWTQGTTPTHVYGAPGSYSPRVTLTDEAGNSSEPLATSTVVVKADKARPTIRLTPPRTRKSSVASWRTLKGRAADAQTGVRNVVLKAIENRRGDWYAYKADTRSWVKAKSKRAAWKRTVAASVRPTQGKWSVKVAKLRKGRLLYRARAFDNRANASVWVSKRARLTRR